MKQRPIVFDAAEVRAVIAGTKTQARRIARNVIEGSDGKPLVPRLGKGTYLASNIPTRAEYDRELLKRCPYGVIGDRLWVREAFAWSVRDPESCAELGDPSNYDPVHRATYEHVGEWERHAVDASGKLSTTKGAPTWRPASHMPRWASRITLEVTAVRVDRLHAITEDDARAEGVEAFFTRFPEIGRDQSLDGELCADAEHRASFKVRWDETNGARALWIANPFVWVVEFKRVEADAVRGAA